jgi:glycosyltransferase involved in cell wall biosynthesis
MIKRLRRLRDLLFRPKVSIVMPVYNGANYLGVALRSVLNQSYRNLEVIVVDDGSTDNTEQIVKSFTDKRLKYIKKANGGVASALNKGIEAMTSDYFCWLSHDDVFARHKIKRQVRAYWRFRRTKDVILISDYRLIDRHGVLITSVCLDHDLIAAKPAYAVFRGLVHGCSIFAPRRLFDEIGKFDEALPYTQDYDLWLRALGEFRFVHMQKFLIKSRWHPEQSSKKGDYAREHETFWIKAMGTLSDRDKIALAGSLSEFYRGMVTFLREAGIGQAATIAYQKMQSAFQDTSKPSSVVKVSVIIPFHRDIELLRAAVSSVTSQTYPSIELIVVYDSPDIDILDALPATAIPGRQIRLLCQNRRGAGMARNFGIEHASGAYLAFLDADDIFLPMKIERQLKLMRESGAEFSHTSYFAFGRESRRKSFYAASGRFTGNVFPEVVYNCPIAMPTVMAKSELLKERYRFPDMQNCEDVVLWMHIGKDMEILGIDEPLSVVTISPESVAYDPAKQREALLKVVSYLKADREMSNYPDAIARLEDTIADLAGDTRQGVS